MVTASVPIPKPPCLQQNVAEMAQHLAKQRGTGKVQLPGHIICTQTLRQASQHLGSQAYLFTHASPHISACTWYE